MRIKLWIALNYFKNILLKSQGKYEAIIQMTCSLVFIGVLNVINCRIDWHYSTYIKHWNVFIMSTSLFQSILLVTINSAICTSSVIKLKVVNKCNLSLQLDTLILQKINKNNFYVPKYVYVCVYTHTHTQIYAYNAMYLNIFIHKYTLYIKICNTQYNTHIIHYI